MLSDSQTNTITTKEYKTTNNVVEQQDNNTSTVEEEEDDNNGIIFKDWGLKIDRLFEVAYRFYKRNESKAFHPTFDTRNQMNALILQARYGNFDGVKAPDVGALDLVGKSRRYQWSLLKGMSKTEAMSKFILTLDEICPFFKAHAEAVKISVNNSPQNINRSDQNHWPSSASTSSKNSIGIYDGLDNNNMSEKDYDTDDQLKAIRTSLYRQTYDQFKSYAEKQYPDDLPKRKYLIGTLQEQYYQQYISQMHPEINKTTTANNSTSQLNIDNSLEANQNGNKSMEPSSSIPKQNPLHSSEDQIVTTVDSNKTTSPNNNFDNIQQMQCTETNGNNNIDISNNKTLMVTDILENNNQSEQQNKVQYEETNKLSQQIPNDNGSSLSMQQQSIESQEQTNGLNCINKMKIEPNNHQPNDKFQQTPIMYQHNILAQNIGQFESYPAPKPIQNPNVQQQQNSLISVAINMFNSSTTNTMQKSQSPEVQQPLPVSSSSNVGEQTTKISSNVNDNYFTPINLESSDSKEQSLHQLPIPFQPLPSPPLPMQPEIREQLLSSFQDANNYGQTTNEILNQNTYVKSNDQPNKSNVGEQQQKPPVETWDCGSSDGRGSPLQNTITYEPLEPASIWTKKGVIDFRESLVNDKHGGMQVVNQGVSLTIQVPTYPDGRYIHFEFCTEDFDIAFGLDFVYDSYLPDSLSLRIYEETDTEDEDEDEHVEDGVENMNNLEQDIELAGDRLNRITRRDLLARKRAHKLERLANTVSIVPTYRRESHEEVFIGRHRYPGQGYYLLKFDNTYSVLRSKTLYFRICYLI